MIGWRHEKVQVMQTTIHPVPSTAIRVQPLMRVSARGKDKGTTQRQGSQGKEGSYKETANGIAAYKLLVGKGKEGV